MSVVAPNGFRTIFQQSQLETHRASPSTLFCSIQKSVGSHMRDNYVLCSSALDESVKGQPVGRAGAGIAGPENAHMGASFSSVTPLVHISFMETSSFHA